MKKKCLFVNIIITLLLILNIMSHAEETAIYNDITIGSTKKEREDISRMLKEIELHEKNEDFDKTEQTYEKLIEKYPKNYLYLKFGEFYARNDKFDKATECFYKSVNRLEYEYRTLERLFYKYQMLDEVAKLYYRLKDMTADYSMHQYYDQRLINLFSILNNYESILNVLFAGISKGNESSSYYIDELKNLIKDEDFISWQETNNKENIIIEKLTEILKEGTVNYNGQVSILLGELYLGQKDGKKAIKYIKQGIENSLYLFDYEISKFVDKFVVAGDYQNAISVIDYYFEKFGISSENVREWTREAFFLTKKKIDILIKLNEYENVIKIINNILSEKKHLIKKAPLYFNLYQFVLGEVYFKKREYKKAVDVFLQTEANDKTHIRQYIAKCYLGLEQYQKAEEVLNVLQSSAGTWYYLGLTYLFNKKIEKSLYSFEKLILNYGEDELSSKALEKVNVLNDLKDNADALAKFIVFERLLFHNDLEKIVLLYDKLTSESLFPALKTYYKYQYVKIFIKQKRYKRAEAILKEIMDEKLNDFFVQKGYIMLSRLYIEELNKPTEGKQLLFALLKEYPVTVFRHDAQELLKKVQNISQ